MKTNYNKFDILISTHCNMNCKYCIMRDHIDGSMIDINAIIHTLFLYDNVTEVHFAGGEPFYNTSTMYNMYRIIKFLEKYRVQYKITSNLTSVDFSKWNNHPEFRYVLDHIDMLSTSFDNNGIRFTSIDQIVKWYKNIKWLRENTNIKLNCFCILSEDIVGDNDSSSKTAEDYDRVLSKLFDSYRFIPLMNSDNCISNESLKHFFGFYTPYINIPSGKNNTRRDIEDNNYANCMYNGKMICIDGNGKVIKNGCFIDNNCLAMHSDCVLCKMSSLCGTRCKAVRKCTLDTINKLKKYYSLQ